MILKKRGKNQTITNLMFDFTVEKVKAKYKDSDGDCNTVILQFIYCRVARDKVYVWLTSEDKVNLVEVKGNMRRYSVGLDSQEDILNYIEEYLTKDGYAEDLKIDYDYYDEEEFKRKIDVFGFSENDEDCIKHKSLSGKYEFWIDENEKYYTNIYLLQKSTGDMRLAAKLINNTSYDYEEYCAGNISNATEYFFDKA